LRFEPSQLPERKQQFLKAMAGIAWTEIIPSELFAEFFVSVYGLMAALYPCFGWEAFAAFASSFESRKFVWSVYFSWLHLLVGTDDITDGIMNDRAFDVYNVKISTKKYLQLQPRWQNPLLPRAQRPSK
jgi:hypothetical protein